MAGSAALTTSPQFIYDMALLPYTSLFGLCRYSVAGKFPVTVHLYLCHLCIIIMCYLFYLNILLYVCHGRHHYSNLAGVNSAC